LQAPIEQHSTQTISQEQVGGVTYNVQHIPTTLQSTPQDIVLFEPADGFWLGALLQETGLRQGIGAQQELPVTPEQRAPLHLSSNLLLSSDAITVARPSRSAVQEALGELVQKAMAAGKKNKGDDFSGSFTAQVVENNSTEQTAFSLGLSAKYLGSSVKAKLASKKSATQRTLTILCIQKAFTVQTDLRGERGADAFFSEAFTEQDLGQLRKQRLIGENNRPTYISAITYGRMILFSLTTTKDISSLKGKLAASLNLAGKNGASLDVEASDLLKDSSTQIDVFSVGGPQAASEALIRSGKLGDFFKSEVPLNTLTPIGYTVRTVKDNQLAAMLQTTQYDLTNYAAQAPTSAPLYRVTSFFKITNSSDGVADNNVECYGEVRVNSEKAWEIPSSAAEQNKKQTGQTIDLSFALPGTRPTSYYQTSAASFVLSGFLKDSDKALNGADDTLYSFNLTLKPAELAGKGEVIYKGPAAELHIRVEKV
jgi:Thiol-activated cytolysin